MLKLITGFLLGVVATLAVVFWFDTSAPETKASLTDPSTLAEKITEIPRSGPVLQTSETAEHGSDDPNTLASAKPVLNEEPSASEPQAAGQPQQDARSMSAAQRSSTRVTNNNYPPEIADMIENSVDKDLQARYESDEREDSWAPYMEGLLAAYFAQKPELAQFYFSLIDCRTSICEIHALGYGVDALTQWNAATADMVSQPWFEFNSMSMNRRNPEPDILGIVVILTKKPPN
ncbi:MAG: hypothetical protein K0U72_03095 [Gammaproteobacteria bacterium]|nr:hypothetical protein [Gammaproteobacteria bacterium]